MVESEKIKNVRDALKTDAIKVDDARVKITEMQLNAIQKLADNRNEVFSEIDKAETNDVTKAYVFSENPLPNINQKLEILDTGFKIELPVLTSYLDRMIQLRHSAGRGRVREYIDAIQAVSPKLSIQERPDDQQRRGLLGGRLL